MDNEMNASNLPRLLLALFFGWPTMHACTEGDLPYPEPLPVVEAYLAPDQPATVQITREISYGSADTLMALSGLSPRITYNGQSYPLAEASPGRYRSSEVPLVAGGIYGLSFSYNGREITAEAEIPMPPGAVTASATDIAVPNFGSGAGAELPDPIIYTWDNPDRAYHLLVVRNTEVNPTPITFNIGGSPVEKPEPAFRLPPHRGDSQQVTLGRFSYYGKHAVILYRIQPEYAALYESSGSNSNDLMAPPTNISGGLGIFTGVHAADTLWVHVW